LRILITGAAGFIGSNLLDALRVDHQVWGFDNFLTGHEENISWEEVVNVDIAQRHEVYSVANTYAPEVVIHCAASYSDPDLWHRDTETNVAGCINAAAVAKHHGAHLIYFQTILPPVSSYAISKIAGEQYLRLSGVPLTVLRLANIYGPRNLSGPIPVFYKRLTEGLPIVVVDTTRDFVFIEDLVRAVRTVVTERLTGTFDVCSGEQVDILEMYYRLVLIMGKSTLAPPILPPDPDDVQGVVDPRHGVPGWSPQVSWEEGMARTLESYREHGVTQTHTHLRIGEKDAS
jgi:UDP-glucose 4-epimerase